MNPNAFEEDLKKLIERGNNLLLAMQNDTYGQDFRDSLEKQLNDKQIRKVL